MVRTCPVSIVVALVIEGNNYFVVVPVAKWWRDLRIVLSGRGHMQIEDSVCSGINQ